MQSLFEVHVPTKQEAISLAGITHSCGKTVFCLNIVKKPRKESATSTQTPKNQQQLNDDEKIPPRGFIVPAKTQATANIDCSQPSTFAHDQTNQRKDSSVLSSFQESQYSQEPIKKNFPKSKAELNTIPPSKIVSQRTPTKEAREFQNIQGYQRSYNPGITEEFQEKGLTIQI